LEGRYPSSIMLTLAASSDPTRVAEWLDWYAHIHTPDVTSGRVFTNMIRFMNTESDHGGRQVANFSESDFEDPVAALEELKRRRDPFRDPSRNSPLTTVAKGGGPFISIGGEFQFIRNSPVRGIYVESTLLEESRDSQVFNNWYNDTRIYSMLRPGIFQSAYRYQAVTADGPENRYLCVYETDRSDVAAAVGENIAMIDDPDSDLTQMIGVKVQWEMTAERIFPLEGRR